MAKTQKPIGVRMVDPVDKSNVTRTYAYEISKFDRLGKEIRISPKSCVTVNNPGLKAEFYVETISIVIGIGNDHSADLIMSRDAWDALKSGDKIHIDTTEEFKKKYVYR